MKDGSIDRKEKERKMKFRKVWWWCEELTVGGGEHMTDGHEGVTHGLLSTLSVVYDRLSVVRSLCSFREKLSRYYLRRGSSSNFFFSDWSLPPYRDWMFYGSFGRTLEKRNYNCFVFAYLPRTWIRNKEHCYCLEKNNVYFVNKGYVLEERKTK